MPRLSIVIPVLGNLERLEDTLVSVLENRPDDSEVVVVLNETYDDPYDLKDEIHFVQATPRADLATSVNLGIGASQAPIVHVLACGVQVREGWADAALPHFADPWVASVAPLVRERGRPERVVSAGITYQRGGRQQILGQGRSVQDIAEDRAAILGPHATAAFYRKSALEMVGRFSSIAGDELAALDLALRLAYVGFRAVRELDCSVCADRPRPSRRGALRRAFHAERLFWRWAPCFGRWRSLVPHATTVAMELGGAILTLTLLRQLAGRALGLGFCISGGRHRRELNRLRESVRAAVAAAGSPHFRPATAAKAAESAAGNTDPQPSGPRKKGAAA